MVKPDPGERPDSLFQKIYATVFLTLLLAVLGGGLCVWGAKSAIATQETYERGIREKGHGVNLFNIFYFLGIRDWRAQFGIGAAVGTGAALLFMKRNWDVNRTND